MEGEGSTTAPVINIVSRSIVRPSAPPPRRSIHLTPWDLRFLSIQYIQKGILLPTPQQVFASATNLMIDRLISTLITVLSHFYPLAGRLSTTHHATSPPSLSVSIDCNNEGVEFTHATADYLTSSDILSPPLIPPIVSSFFPLNEVISHDGHSHPLLAVQATILADGAVFLACSLNHAVADGTIFWHFLNSWSAVSRSSNVSYANPTLDRWFPPSLPPPISLPFKNLKFESKTQSFPALSESVFLFSGSTIRQLKSNANTWMELNTNGVSGSHPISSLQALLAHVWVCVTRARKLPPHQHTSYSLAFGCRSRLNPQLPAEYLGNCLMVVVTGATAGELLVRGHGWAARRLNEVVGEQTEAEVRKQLESWAEKPKFCEFGAWKTCDLITGSSPRFDVYGNDFGWGRPVAVRSGGANKFDGKVSVFPGPEDGSMALEICLSSKVLSTLMEDHEFMHSDNGSQLM